MVVDEGNKCLGEEEKKLVSDVIGLSPNKLNPILDIQFSRITLTDKNFNERLTIDMNLYALNGTKSTIFDQLVISEIKQKKYSVIQFNFT